MMSTPKHSKLVTRPMTDYEIETLPAVPDEIPREPTPSIGRVVHYTWNGLCTASMITSVNDEKSVNLVIFSSSEIVFRSHVQLGEGEGTWHWPEIV